MLAWNAAAGRSFLRGLVVAVVAGGCSGGGCNSCGGMEPLPGGFPAEFRVANAIQVRVTDSAIATLEDDPAALVGPLLGQEGLSIDVPASCGGDPEICCSGGTPAATCGPLDIDLAEQAGDLPRLEVIPVAGQQRVDIVVRARLTSAAPIPVSYLGISCDVSIDTAGGARDGITLSMDVQLPQDVDELTTRMEVGDTTVDFEDDDITLGGGFLCGTVDTFLKGFIVNLLTENISALVGDSLGGQSCVACESGTTSECGAFADACTDGVCMIGDRCEQRLGIAGRLSASGLFGGFSGGQLGRMDLYDVAGGYTETDDDGVSMGLYSGALPFAEARDRCGPSAQAPAIPSIPESAFFSGNTRPDTGAPFHVGIGVHQQVLDQLAYAAYESGSLCLNITPGAVDLLNTDGLAPLLMPSVVDLLHGKSSPIVMGLRPQSVPTIQIGAGTTTEGAGGETEILEPLLDVRFDEIEIDFFVVVDDQFIRVMTLGADIHLPLNLEINALGEIEPVLGNVDEAFTDIHVSNSEALRESDTELEEKIPVLLSLALPPLLDGLGSFALPSLGGLDIAVAEDGILSVEDDAFIAIYADLVLGGTTARVNTEASLRVDRQGTAPVAVLSMRGDRPGLEYAFRIDGGLWSPYTRSSELYLERVLFTIAGEHRIEVRARQEGRPATTDRSPVVLTARFSDKLGETYFHGNSRGEGCACNGSGSSSLWLAALVLLLLMRRPRRYARHLALLALVGLSGCTCSSDPAGSPCLEECLEGAVEHGQIGRYSSLAASPTRVVAAAYDEGLGDLVLVERDETGGLTYRAIAGIPDEPPTYEPDTYRGGVATPGPDQGLWTSIALHEDRVLVAFVGAEDGAVYLAREQEDGRFQTELVDDDTGVSGASYLSLSISSSGTPSVAYLAHGIASPDHDGLLSQVRVADGGDAWAHQVVDVGPIGCGGLCQGSDLCVDIQSIQECKSPSGTCDAGCDDTQGCIDGVCETVVEAPAAPGMPDGVGLFTQLLHLGDDSMVLGYYDRVLGNVQLATSTGTGFVPAANYDDPTLDTGMWLTMAAGDNNDVHLAFQDATGDRLMYAHFEGGVLAPPEFVDDGVRSGDERTHPVGASAAIVFGRDRAPTIVYQDGLTSDVEVARNEQGSWQRTTLMEGPRLDGFFVDAANGGDIPWVSHYFYDRAEPPMGELEIFTLP